MAFTPVKSTNLSAVHYDPDTCKLTVEFKSGARHCYDDVPPEKHADLMKADSIGSHFHKHIRSGHKSSPVK